MRAWDIDHNSAFLEALPCSVSSHCLHFRMPSQLCSARDAQGRESLPVSTQARIMSRFGAASGSRLPTQHCHRHRNGASSQLLYLEGSFEPRHPATTSPRLTAKQNESHRLDNAFIRLVPSFLAYRYSRRSIRLVIAAKFDTTITHSSVRCIAVDALPRPPSTTTTTALPSRCPASISQTTTAMWRCTRRVFPCQRPPVQVPPS